MERELKELFPLLGVEEDCILSRRGDYTLAYRVHKPEVFTLSSQDLETMHQAFVRALKVLPKHSIFHMADWYTDATWRADEKVSGDSFLSRASDRHFHERPYLEHTAYIYLTRMVSGKLPISATSTLLRRSIVPADALDELVIREFLDSCGQFVRILQDGGFRLERLGRKDIWSTRERPGILERYCMLNEGKQGLLNDISLQDGLRVGDDNCLLFTLGDADDLPGVCGPRIDYARYSTDTTRFSVGFASALGQLLPCRHVYNQYIFIEDGAETLKRLERKRRRMEALSVHSRENAAAADAVAGFLQEAASAQRTLVKAHYNVMTWSNDPAELKNARNLVTSALVQLGATPKQETVGVGQIWWAGLPGNEADLPSNECFDTFLEQACCFLHAEGSSMDMPSPFGFRLVDRLSGRPLHVDISDEPMARRLISNRNKVILGNSGSGKSLFMAMLMRCYYEQGAHLVVVDVGNSYKWLCQLLGGYYFTYEETGPLSFNPFYVAPGDVFDTEKRESVKALLLALWKREDESFRRSEYVALSNALSGYMDHLAVHPDIFPCFNSFYEFLQTVFLQRLQADQVHEKDFDVRNFLYVLRPYYLGGEFGHLLNARQNLDLLQQRFIVFELDKVRDHPILFPVITLIVMELFIGKMRKLPGIRKVITIEEAWKAIAKAGMAEFVRYLYKTVRKFFGEVNTVTQEVEDLVGSPVVKDTIINVSDCKIILDLSKFVHKFDQLQAALGLTDKAKSMILSLNRANDPTRRYRELFIDLAGHSKVYGFEPSMEEYYAYTTEERERVLVTEYASRYGSLQKGIEMLVRDKREKGEI